MNSTIPPPISPDSPRAKPVPWGWRDLMMAIVTATLLVLALNLVLLGAGRALHMSLNDNRDVLAIFLAVQDVIIVGTALLFSIAKYRVGWDRLGLRTFSLPVGCGLSITLLLASYIVRVVYGLVAYAVGLHIQQQEVLSRLDTQGTGFILTLFVAAVVAPIAEEIFFRGFLYSGLRARIGVLGAMLASALFFTGLHLSVELFIPILVLGLFLAWLYESTGSLYPGILLHAANNALSLILLFVLQALGQTPS